MHGETLVQVAILLAVGAVIWGLWRAAQPRRMFLVRIVHGIPEAVEGTVTQAFLECVREVAAAHEISRGSVSGHAFGAFIRLNFSAEFSPSARQQLRNWWAASGWPAPRSAARRRVR